ncbi:MAG TPA: hypothetical protein ENN09_05130, partial [Planctomycetes bacterium]|nr:hypothetical protein [Planctomycetota bacterium]
MRDAAQPADAVQPVQGAPERPAAAKKELSPLFAEPVQGWIPVGLSGGGSMFAASVSAADPMVMMVSCDMSAAYVSKDGGRRWRMIHHSQLTGNTRCRPGLHPKDRNIMYAARGSRIYRSDDMGEKWREIANTGVNIRGEINFDHDEPSLMIAGAENGAVISRDGGMTWETCAGVKGEGRAFHVDRTSPRERRTIFAATAEGIWRSDDGGRNWVEKTRGLPWKEIASFGGGSNPDSGICMVYCSVTGKDVDGGYRGGIFRSNDRGESWEWAMGEGIDRGIVKADEWGDVPVAQYPFVLGNNAAPMTVLAANRGTGFHPPHHPTIYRSDDGGESWRATLYMDQRFEKCNVEWDYFMAARDGKAYQPPPWTAACSPSNPDVVVRITGIAIISHDGGRTWFNGHITLAPGQKPGRGCFWVNTGLVVTTTWHYYVDPHDHNRHYIAYTDIGFARSTDGGATWAWWDDANWAPWRNTCYEIAFDPDVPGKMWGAFSDVHDIPNGNIIYGNHWNNNPERGPGGVCVSTNAGVTWKPSGEGMPTAPVTSIVLDPKSPKGNRTLYATVFGRGVYKSSDDGRTWESRSNGLGHPSNTRLYRVILHKDGTLFAIVTARRVERVYHKEGVGLYRSKDGGESWRLITSPEQILWPKDFEVHPDDSNVIFVGAAATNEPAT